MRFLIKIIINEDVHSTGLTHLPELTFIRIFAWKCVFINSNSSQLYINLNAYFSYKCKNVILA